MKRATIEKTLSTIYDKVFNEGQAELFPSLVASPYIQHNPTLPNGPEAIVAYVRKVGRVPCEVKRIAIDGNFAFVHVHYHDWAGVPSAAVDIFRFNADGRVAEHWDVLQAIPASAQNTNTMF